MCVCVCVHMRASQVALVVKNPPVNAGDIRNVGSVPGLGRCPGGGHATHSTLLIPSVGSISMQTHELYSPWNSPGQNTGVGSLSLLQGIFPTQGSNPGLLHCRRILYQLSHKGSPIQTENRYSYWLIVWSINSNIYSQSQLLENKGFILKTETLNQVV